MSTGQALGGVVGGVVGAFIGGPAGALQGFSIGMSIGGVLDPPKGQTVEGPRLSDKSIQTSTYGTMLPRFYGTIGVFSNITWLENNQLKETVRKKKQGGKGGGSTTTTKIYTYSATFFLSLGLGPIAGIRRIWCSDRLIYNAGSDDLETIIASNQAATGFRVYLGTDDQLPDPRYEADVGVGNASAYRGEAYIAFYDFQLADFGNTLQGAQFKVEVVTSDENQSFQAHSTATSVVGADGDSLEAGQLAIGDSGEWKYLYTSAGVERTYTLWPSGAVSTDTEIINYTHLENLNCHGFTGAFPFGVCIRPALNARYFRAGSNYYLHPSASGSFGSPNRPSAGFVVGDYLYIMSASSLGQRSIYKLSPSAAFVGGTGVAVAAITVPDAELTIFQAGGYLCTVNGSTVRRYSLDDLSFVDSHTVAGLSVSSSYVAVIESNESIYVIDCFTGNPFNNFRFPSDFSAPATSFSLDTSGDPVLYAAISGGFLGAVFNDSGTVRRRLYRIDKPEAQTVSLAEIIEQEIELSSLLTASDVDTSLLTAEVRGYRVSGGSIRSALEPLQGAYPFDIIQSGYQLKCVPRGQASAVTIPWEDLGAADGDTPGDLLQESREMDSQLPALVAVKYLDAAREYAVGEQSKGRINTQAINRVDREVSLVLTADEAAAMADVLVNLPWLERTPAKFTLPPPYLDLEPADVVTVVTPSATHEFRLTDINYTPDGRLECEAKPKRAALYTSTAKGGEGVPPSGQIPMVGPTLLVLLDIPVVDETVQNAPGFGAVAVGYTPGWPGAVAFRSIDAGQTWTELQGFTGLPTLGYARGTLPTSACTLIDQRTLVVDLLAGALESVTRDQMLAGINYAAYGANGRWEIVRFQNAALQGDGSYLLSGFVRGDRGTEWATGLHQAGDLFVLLDDPDNVFIDMAVGSIGVPATYRGVTSGATIDSASDVPFTYQGVNLECLSPVGANGVRDASGNFSATFVRRSRLSSSWWTTGVPAPIGETTEAYDIEVMDGSTAIRTITAASPEFDYPAADQVVDFGSAQSSITFRIYQRSDVVGRGYHLEVTL